MDQPAPTPSAPAGTARILHVSRPAAGGLKQHLASLLYGLSQLGQSCALAGPASLIQAIGEDESFPHGLPLIALEITDRPGPARDILAAMALRGIAADFALVHAHGMRAGWIAALSGRRPFVLTAHNLYTPPHPRPLGWLGGYALRSSALTIAVSEAVAGSLRLAGAHAGRIRVVPNGIVFPRPLPARTPREVRRCYALPSEAPLVLCVARLMADKGVDMLIRAWATIRRQVPSGRCLIAGDGPDMASLRALAAGCEGLAFAGRVEDVESLYAAADVVAIPSRREGQSLVCLEAMASNPAPAVVATDAGGLPEMVNDGVTGLVVPAADEDALAASVIRLLKDSALRASLSTAAAGVVAARYSANAMCEATLAVYHEALSAVKPGR